MRVKRSYSLRQLAIICDLNYSFISQLENHRRGVPKIPTINKLAKGLKIPPNRMYQVKCKNKIDLARTLNSPIKVEWNSHPLDHNDLLAIRLWFKHRKE